MYVTKILLQMNGPKTDVNELRELFMALHSDSLNVKFGVIFPKMQNNSFGNQINVYHKNEDDMNSHMNGLHLKRLLNTFPNASSVIKEEMIKDTNGYMSIKKDNVAKHCSKSGIRSSLKFLDKHQNLELDNKDSRLYQIAHMRELGFSIEKMSEKLKKISRKKIYLNIHSKSSDMEMRINFHFQRKSKNQGQVDWDKLTSYGLSNGEVYFPIV